MIQHLKKGRSAQAKASDQAQIRSTVEGILSAIEQRGDSAVREYSEKFDAWSPPSLRLSQEQIDACIASLPEQTLEDIRFAQAQIRRFAEIQKASMHDVEVETLPTMGAGRYTGGLWVGKFIKTHTYQRVLTDEACVMIGNYCSRLCGYEHMSGHKEQADIRVRRMKQEA